MGTLIRLGWFILVLTFLFYPVNDTNIFELAVRAVHTWLM